MAQAICEQLVVGIVLQGRSSRQGPMFPFQVLDSLCLQDPSPGTSTRLSTPTDPIPARDTNSDSLLLQSNTCGLPRKIPFFWFPMPKTWKSKKLIISQLTPNQLEKHSFAFKIYEEYDLFYHQVSFHPVLSCHHLSLKS